MRKKSPTTVTAYIAAAPPKARAMMKQLRTVIRSTAPQAEEKLSYGMPYYGYHGRLIYFSAFRHHIGLYIMGRSQKVFLAEQKKYKHGRATLQFPIGTKVPVTLVRKLVKARLAEVNVQKSK